MVQALTPEQARSRFRAVARGRFVDHGLDVREAKVRLQQTAPGLDIAPLLSALERRDPRLALLALLPWVMGPEGRAFLQPVAERGLLVAFRSLGVLEGIIRHALKRGRRSEAGPPRERGAAPPSTK